MSGLRSLEGALGPLGLVQALSIESSGFRVLGLRLGCRV